MSVESKGLIKVDQSLLPEHQKIKGDFFISYNNVYELFGARAQERGKEVFAIFPERGQTFTYQEFNRQIIRQANYLGARGLGRGERISLVMPTTPEFISLYFAALKQGIAVVPINPDLSPPEMSYIMGDAQVSNVFFNDQLAEKVSFLQKDDNLSHVKFINVASTNVGSEAEQREKYSAHYTDEAVVIYTSGTTGNPKGARLSHLNLLVDAEALAKWFHFTPETRTLCILPLFHNNGQVVTLLAPVSAGGSTVMVPPKISLKLFWSLILEYGISWTSVMPSILSIVLSLKLERKDSSMQGIICGGQVLTEELKTQFENNFGVPIFEGYGLTETTSFACFNQFPKEARQSGSVGRPLPCNDIAILDDNGQEADRNEAGELCIRGLNVMIEYLGLPEVNQRALRGGWFHSGDYGYMDKDGNIYFQTRKDYLIIKGGENIYPSEIENVLFKHPAVDECAVLGVPDKFMGQEIVAFIKLNSDCTEKELKDFLDGKLAHYKYPKRIFLINELADLDDIPKGPTKKVLYKVLLAYYNKHLKKND